MAWWYREYAKEQTADWAIGEDRYVGGMGLTFAAVVFLLTGIRLFGGAERLLLSIPVVKSGYGALHDFFSLFARRKGGESLQVVAVEIPGTDMRLLGFVIARSSPTCPTVSAARGRRGLSADELRDQGLYGVPAA
jgi:uncharacterized membrane protein